MNTYQTIEIGRGATYQTSDWHVYEHGTYEQSSVLSGQSKRSFLDCFESLEDAKTAYPKAEVWDDGCSSFQEVSLSHLPDDDRDYCRPGEDW